MMSMEGSSVKNKYTEIIAHIGDIVLNVLYSLRLLLLPSDDKSA